MGHRPEGEYCQDVEDEIHRRIEEEEANESVANQSACQIENKDDHYCALGDCICKTLIAKFEHMQNTYTIEAVAGFHQV